MVRDRAHLAELIAWLEGAGVDRAFVVGGDAKEPGDFLDGLSLLREMADIGHPLAEIGIPCYPQGHAVHPGRRRSPRRSRTRQPYASYMTTQLCFDPAAIATWLAARRADGHRRCPSISALPGVAEPHKLLAITRADRRRRHAAVPDQEHPVRRAPDPVRRFYRPDGLLEGLAPLVADPVAGVGGLHLYTFNNGRDDRGLAAALPRVAGGGAAGLTGGGTRCSRRAPDRSPSACRSAEAAPADRLRLPAPSARRTSPST